MVSLELCSSVPRSIKVPWGIPNINSRLYEVTMPASSCFLPSLYKPERLLTSTCHSGPFACCHSDLERSEGGESHAAQACPGQSRRGKLHEESLQILRPDLSGLLRMTLLNAL